MKTRIFTTLLFFLFLYNRINSQCPPPGYPAPSGSCQMANVICDDLDGYCGALPFPATVESFPGCAGSTLNNDQWISFVAGSTDISILIIPSNCTGGGIAGMQAAVFAGTCSDDPMISQCSCTGLPFTLSSTDFEIGQNYFLVLDGCNGGVCDYAIEIINGSTIPTSPPPFIPLGPTVVCYGDAVNYSLPVQNGAAYNWSVIPPTAGNFTNPVGSEVVFTPLTSYTTFEICVEGTNACGLSSSITCLTVESFPIPTENITVDLCPGECVQMFGATICPDTLYLVYVPDPIGCDTWYFIYGNPISGVSTDLGDFEMPCEGVFEIGGIPFTNLGYNAYSTYNPSGCDSIFSFLLLPGELDVSVSKSGDLNCDMDQVELAGIISPLNAPYYWTTVNGSFVSGQNTLNPVVDEPGYYCLTVENDTSDCTVTDCTFVIENHKVPKVEFLPYEAPCEGQVVELCVEVDPIDNANYTWYTNGGHFVTYGAKCVTVDQLAKYCLRVTSYNGCDTTVCVDLTNDLSVAIEAPANTCNGPTSFTLNTTASFIASGTVFWEIGQSGIQQMDFDTLPFLVADTFHFSQDTLLTAWVVDSNGCPSDTVQTTVQANVLDINFSVTQDICDEAIIEAEYGGVVLSYQWNTGSTESFIVVSGDGNFSVTIQDANGCTAEQDIFYVADFTNNCAHLEGTVNRDELNNCLPDLADQPLAGWTVKATGIGEEYYATTKADGTYTLPVEPGSYLVTVLPPSNLWEICADSISVDLPIFGQMVTVDFLVFPVADCPLMSVDISSSIIRVCNENFYALKYCNLGTVTATNAFIDVVIDPLMTFSSSTIPSSDLGNNVIQFQLGDIGPLQCGNFTFTTNTDCSAPVGFTHCTEAHIYPDTTCISPNPLWSEASLEITGACSDSTRFTIKNVGSGKMSEPLTYTIFRNTGIYLFQQKNPLSAGETQLITLPADTATWRVEVDQEPFFPYSSKVISTVHGCTPTGLLETANSYINDMVLADQDNFLDEDCRPNVGSFDPNVKQGSPTGYAAEHFIPDATRIEYYVRFQNTGSDTAFSIIVRDTLSKLLDISTLQMGASSHAYTYELIGERVLKINFPNIKLPHRDVDEPGSIGFFEFKIAAKAGLAPLTRIENSASIYFDLNPPVKTNTTFHTIEKPVVHSYQEVELCKGEVWNGQPIFADSVISTIINFLEYDSMAWTNIHLIPFFESSITAQFCADGSYDFYGEILNTPGEYETVLTASTGCDSLIYLELEEVNAFDISQNAEICKGETYEFNGEDLTEEGHYEAQLTSVEGCDSLVTLNLTVWAVYENGRAATICYGDSAEFNGAHFYETGIYTAELTTIYGCDSILILDLTVLDSIGSHFSQTICENEPFVFNGETLTEAGTYEAVFPSAEGCDSTVVLSLEVEPIFSDTNELNVVSGELYNGQPIFNDTTIIENLVAQNGCDSVIVTNITVEVNGTRDNMADAIGLSFFPNPTDGSFFVKFNLHDQQNVRLEILDIIGQKIVSASQKRIFPAGEHFEEINAEGWPSGVYLVHFQMDSGVATGRVVVE